jgi:hypothetical protein
MPSTIRSKPTINSPWPFLETLPGLIALPGVWRTGLGEMFEPVKTLILRASPNPAQLLPCPRGCGLAHDIVCRPDGSLAALCCGDPSRPQEILLAHADIMPLEVNWSGLGRALCQALGLDSRFRTLLPPNTVQFGAWSAEAVPAILTIQVCPAAFRRAVSELAAGLQRPFMLFAPTTNYLDAPGLGFLTGIRSAFFSLDSTVLLGDDGRLRAAKPPGELFAAFTPQPDEEDETTALKIARAAYALARKLQDQPGTRTARLFDVFERYVVQALSIAEVARKCGCAEQTIFVRLEALEKAFGRHPRELRQYSSHFEQIEKSLSHPQARHINRKGAIEGTSPQSGSGD